LAKNINVEKKLEQYWERTSLLKNLNMCEHTTRKEMSTIEKPYGTMLEKHQNTTTRT
jgi:hypothetical protein